MRSPLDDLNNDGPVGVATFSSKGGLDAAFDAELPEAPKAPDRLKLIRKLVRDNPQEFNALVEEFQDAAYQASIALIQTEATHPSVPSKLSALQAWHKAVQMLESFQS